MEKIIIACLIKLLSYHEETYLHSLRMGVMAKKMAKQLGFSEEQEQKLVIGCCLHDFGKVYIPKRILNKLTPLTVIEWESIKRHPLYGEWMLYLEGVRDAEIISVAKYHHERMDGRGYPYGLNGEKIPVFPKICSIIDAYDSMVSLRGYRKPLSPLQAMEELLKHSGTQFDEYYVQEFLNIPEHQLIRGTREIFVIYTNQN